MIQNDAAQLTCHYLSLNKVLYSVNMIWMRVYPVCSALNFGPTCLPKYSWFFRILYLHVNHDARHFNLQRIGCAQRHISSGLGSDARELFCWSSLFQTIDGCSLQKIGLNQVLFLYRKDVTAPTESARNWANFYYVVTKCSTRHVTRVG